MKSFSKSITGVFLVLACAIIVPLKVSGQTGTLKGKIISDKGETLIGAVILVDGKSGTVTDTAGNYELSLDSGTHSLQIKLISFSDKNATLHINAGEVKQLDFTLESSARELKIVVVSFDG